MCIEYNLGMVAGSLSSLRPLLIHFGVSQRSSAGTSDAPGKFTPSYPLEDLDSSIKRQVKVAINGSRGITGRVQGDSVLERTFVENGSEEYIVKTV